ncbi:hypothetical protein HAX54_012119 [Datura stramonium]|uniref:WAP domain-containing protein n=1 Tax=Datura stramonium TaxID=4076 RepID=A0ABS8RIL0_DATST|nr:hypothetical protein [Datura stramonium]
MGGKSSATKLGCVLAFLLYVSVFQLLMANEEANTSELNVLQLPRSNSEALDHEVVQVTITRYDGSAKKNSFCLNTRYCSTDDDCIGAICGPRCNKNVLGHAFCTT